MAEKRRREQPGDGEPEHRRGPGFRGANCRRYAAPIAATSENPTYTGSTWRTPILMFPIMPTARIAAENASGSHPRRPVTAADHQHDPETISARKASGVFTPRTTGKKYHQPVWLRSPNR